jgi:hypothetical protein
MANAAGLGNVFKDCYDVSGLYPHPGGTINRTFNAPLIPGVYYITQEATWWFYCGQFGDPAHINNANNAIAVVVVGTGPAQTVTATTLADVGSPAGTYPITLQGCDSYNPNYNVVLHNGSLTVEEHCFVRGHVWKGDGNFNDDLGEAVATPVGGVTATGSPQVGTNSFSFDGTTGYISTGTTGSVSGEDYFSVSAWVKTTSNDPMVIINQRDANIDGEYVLKIGGIHSYPFDPNPAGAAPGKAYFLLYGIGSNILDLVSTTSVNDGDWHFIRADREGTLVRLFVDGIMEASGNTSFVINLNNTIPTTIGKDAKDNNAYFNGLIDDIRVYTCEGTLRMTNNSTTKSKSATTVQLDSSSIAKSNPVPIVKSDSSPVVKSNGLPAAKSNPVSGKETGIQPAGNKLYPNPASTSVRLQLKDDVKAIRDIRVYDGTGKMIPTPFTRINEGLYEVNIAGLHQGIYIIEAKTAGGSQTFKFIKL